MKIHRVLRKLNVKEPGMEKSLSEHLWKESLQITVVAQPGIPQPLLHYCPWWKDLSKDHPFHCQQA